MNLFDISNKESELQALENEMLKDGFWDDTKKSSIILQKIKTIKNKVELYNKLKNDLNNLIEMSDLLIQEAEENDDIIVDNVLAKEVLSNTMNLTKQLQELEISTLLSGKYDINNAIVTIHPGARRN